MSFGGAIKAETVRCVDAAPLTLDIGGKTQNHAPTPLRARCHTGGDPHGSSTDRGRARVSRRSSRFRARQPAGLDPRKDDRRPPPFQGRLRALDAHLGRQGLGGPALAARMGRHGLEPDRAIDLSRRDAARQRAGTGRVWRQHGRPGDLHLWLRGAEGAIPAAHRRFARLVVSGLLRAGRRIGPCKPEDERPARRRRLGDLGPEDLDHHGPIRRLDFRPRAHQRAGEKAGGHFVLPRRHEVAGNYRSAHPDDRRRPRGQRGLSRRRARSPRRDRRRREQGLGLRQIPARQRAQRHRPRRRLESASRPGARAAPRFRSTARGRRSRIRSSAPSLPRSRWS